MKAHIIKKAHEMSRLITEPYAVKSNYTFNYMLIAFSYTVFIASTNDKHANSVVDPLKRTYVDTIKDFNKRVIT